MNLLVNTFYPGDSVTILVFNTLILITVVILLTAFVGGTFLRRWAAAHHAAWLMCLALMAISPLIAFSSNHFGMRLVSLRLTPETVAPRPTPPAQLPPEKSPSDSTIVAAQSVPPKFEPARPRTFDLDEEITVDKSRSDVPRIQPDHADGKRSLPVAASATPPKAIAAKPLDIRPSVALAVAIWAVGVLFLSLRMLHGISRLRALRRTTKPLDESVLADVLSRVRKTLGMTSLPPILLSEQVTTPIVAGLIRPEVLLPVSLVQKISGSRMHDVLAHECAHVVRRDPLVGVVQRLVAIIYWQHPLIYFMNRQLARCREEVCDNWVLGNVCPADYADTLLEVAVYCRERRSVASTIGLFTLRWKLEDRIRCLLDKHRDSSVRLPSRSRWQALAVVCLFVACASAFQIVAPARAEKRPAAAYVETVKQAAPDNHKNAPAVPNEQNIFDGIVTDVDGKPLQDVQISYGIATINASAISGPDGRFRIGISREFSIPRFPALLAWTNDHSLVGFTSPAAVALDVLTSKLSDKSDLHIVLKRTRAIHVKVATSDGKPAADVRVEAVSGPMPLQSPSTTTDNDGRATLHVPPDADIQWVVALKNDAGFDYFENYTSIHVARFEPLPERVELTLRRPNRIRVATIDRHDKPVAGVFVTPWHLQLPGKISYINFTSSSIANSISDERGIAEFSWLPAEASGISFLENKTGYSCPDQPHWNPEQPQKPVTIRLLRNGEISGVVRFPDGKPAAGISILGEGLGETNRYFRGLAKSAADGTYKMSINPHQSTIVGVADRDWAAASHTAVQLDEGRTLEHLDFVLARGTKIHGRVTVGTERKPERNDTEHSEVVTLIELGERLVGEASKFGFDRGNLTRWTQVDKDGNYEIRVGPGEFTLHLPNTNYSTGAISITVTNQTDLVYNSTAARPAQMRITGHVVKAVDGKPVADAIVHGQSIGMTGYAAIEARTDRNGRFTIDRYCDTDEYGFYARAPEADLAGFKTVPSSQKEVTLQVGPATTVSGYVYDNGGKPVVGQKVLGLFGSKDGGVTSINVNVLTDKDGHYRIPGVAVGSQFEVCLVQGQQTIIDPGIVVSLDRPGEIMARDYVLPRKGAAPAKVERLVGVKTVKPDDHKMPPVDRTYTGTISDEVTKKPIAGATVLLETFDDTRRLSGSYRQVLEKSQHITDAQGHYTFTIRKEHSFEANRNIITEFHAKYAGYVEQKVWSFGVKSTQENCKIALRPGKEITAVVAGPDGTPLANVYISACFVHADEYSSNGFFDYHTDENGRFRMTIPAPGGAALWIVPKDNAPMELFVDQEDSTINDSGDRTQGASMVTSKRGDLGTIKLKKGITLSGTLLSYDGQPVAGQWVYISQNSDRSQGYRQYADPSPRAGRPRLFSSIGTTIDRCAKTDARGQVAFGPLPPGQYSIEPSDHDRSNSLGLEDLQRTPIPGAFYAMHIALGPGDAPKPFTLRAELTIRIVVQYFSSDGKKAKGGNWYCYGQHFGKTTEPQRPLEAKDGRMELLAPSGLDEATLMFLADDANSSLRFRKSADAPLESGRELKLGKLTHDMTDIQVIRYDSPIVLLKATDAAGKPVDSAEVTCRYDNASMRNSPYYGTEVRFDKQKDGRYRSHHLLPDENCTISVTAPGYLPQSRTVSAVEGTTSELVFKLERK